MSEKSVGALYGQVNEVLSARGNYDHTPEDYDAADAALTDLRARAERGERIEALLRRFREWDALNPMQRPVPAPFGDFPYWLTEIDRALAPTQPAGESGRAAPAP